MSEFAPRSREFGSLLIGGGVFLVIITVCMSLMQTGFLEESHGEKRNQELLSSMLDGDLELSFLKDEIDEEQRVLDEMVLKKKRAEAVLASVDELGQVIRLNEDLRLKISEAEEAVVDVEKEKQTYRSQMRSELWPRFVNQTLEDGHLVARNTYEGATISKVDAAGLMVRHKSGVSRIEVASLSSSFREKLDLSVVEAKQVMMEMLARDAKLKRRREKKPGAPTEAEVTAMLANELAKRTEKVNKLMDLIARSEAAASDARYQDRTSRSRSAPQSLETWAARAFRFERAALKYRNQLEEAISRVKEVDPAFIAPKR